MNGNPTGRRKRRSSTNQSRFRNVSVAMLTVFATLLIASHRLAGEEDRTIKPYKVNGSRDFRFGEMLVAREHGIDIYNTTVLNECPPALWNALDVEKVREQLGALRVEKSGPRYWMMDSQIVSFGEKAWFEGLEAQWSGRLDATLLQEDPQAPAPYKAFSVKTKHNMVYSQGKPVYELVDSDGNVYVMQSRSESVSLKSLAQLGRKMKQLPDGWQYRRRILSEDLVLQLGFHRTNQALVDEFGQWYTRVDKK